MRARSSSEGRGFRLGKEPSEPKSARFVLSPFGLAAYQVVSVWLPSHDGPADFSPLVLRLFFLRSLKAAPHILWYLQWLKLEGKPPGAPKFYQDTLFSIWLILLCSFSSDPAWSDQDGSGVMGSLVNGRSLVSFVETALLGFSLCWWFLIVLIAT